MLKRGYVWAGICGGLLAAVSLILAANDWSDPTDIFLVTMAKVVYDLAFAALGVFLIGVFLKGKSMEDAGVLPSKPESNSAADIESLRKKRNWVLGLVLLTGLILPTQSLILNNYRAGFTPINVETIFHILMGLLIIYVVVELFRGKKYILNVLLVALAVAAIISIGIGVWRDYWELIVGSILTFAYFAFAIKAPLDRKNFRIAHLVFLPALLVLGVALGFIYQAPVDQLQTNAVNLDTVFESAHENLQSEYGSFAVKPQPTQLAVQDIQASVSQTDQDYQTLVSGISALDAAYLKQTPSASQRLAIEGQQKALAVINLEHQQDDTVGAFMNFYSNVDFQLPPTDEQKTEINNYSVEIEQLNNQIAAAEVKLQN